MASWRNPRWQVCLFAELALVVGCSAAVLALPRPAPQTSERGFTFSQQQTTYLDVDYQAAYASLMQLAPGLVRLAAYWNQVEPRPGVYDFATLDWLLAHTPPSTKVVLALGMKAPRWPEYFIPAWLQQANNLPDGARVSDDAQLQAALPSYLRTVVEHERGSPVIAYWQVENEPLDPSGPRHWTVGADVLRQEVALVRQLDDQHRPVVETTFVSTNPLRQVPGLDPDRARRVQTLLNQADIVGLDLYPVRGARVLGTDVFVRWPAFIWQHQMRSIQREVGAAGKQAWITELQAEPWLVSQVVYLDRLPRPEIVPDETSWVASEVQADGFQATLLWGAEYWYMRLQRFDDSHWWSAAQQLLL